MYIHIDTPDEALREHAIQRIQYALNGYREDIDGLHLSVVPMRNKLGTKLSHCRLRTNLRHHQTITVEEIQSNPGLAVTRSIERTVRTIRRRLDPAAHRLTG